jgi:hypothetical protein
MIFAMCTWIIYQDDEDAEEDAAAATESLAAKTEK